jgi:FlaG/FlaF family flagellin (archaellin)
MEKRNGSAMKCGYRDRAVSEVIGSILLISIVVTGVSIVGVVLWSQPPQKIPALDAIISKDTVHNMTHIYHDGGDPLSSQDFKILVNSYDYTTNFTKTMGSPSTWATGESLDYNYTGKEEEPQVVQIVYTNAGSSSVLAVANFA